MRALRKRIAEREAAREAEKDKAEPRKPRVRKPSVATHPAFLPMLAIWGLSLGAGSILVMPDALVESMASAAGLSGLGGLGAFAIAAMVALIVGGLVLFAAIAFKRAQFRSAPTGELANVAARRFVPIDPAAELGSESLDSPIEKEPFATEPTAQGASRGPTLGELAANGYELPVKETAKRPAFTRKDYEAALEQTCEGAAETGETHVEDEAGDNPHAPLELDLAQFAALPGRNAVWVEEANGESVAAEPKLDPEPVVETQPEPESERASATEPGVRLSAIEKLRQTPTGDLSLIQMVERFAAALHERQEADHANPVARTSPRRDAALAEALKALTVLSETGLEIEAELGQVQTAANGNAEADALRDTTRELREALAKLQTLRGAA